jgi:hypothetical protein
MGVKSYVPFQASSSSLLAMPNDTDVIQSALADTTCQAKVKLQEAIDLWEFNLKATCGALVPEKTVW